MEQQVAQRKLQRSHNACIGGVCAGLAEQVDFDPIVIRILAILLTGVTFGLAAVAYVVLWLCLPRASEPSAPYDITPEHAESIAHGSIDCGRNLEEARGGIENVSGLSMALRLAIAAGLMLLFLVVAMNGGAVVSGTEWWEYWPIALIIVGLCLIVVPVRTSFETVWHAIGVVVVSLAATMLPMSLGVVGWDTFQYAFSHLWVLVVGAVALFGIGLYQRSGGLVMAGSFCLAAFCLVGLLVFSLPGDVPMLFISMPDGSSLRIAVLST